MAAVLKYFTTFDISEGELLRESPLFLFLSLFFTFSLSLPTVVECSVFVYGSDKGASPPTVVDCSSFVLRRDALGTICDAVVFRVAVVLSAVISKGSIWMGGGASLDVKHRRSFESWESQLKELRKNILWIQSNNNRDIVNRQTIIQTVLTSASSCAVLLVSWYFHMYASYMYRALTYGRLVFTWAGCWHGSPFAVSFKTQQVTIHGHAPVRLFLLGTDAVKT